MPNAISSRRRKWSRLFRDYPGGDRGDHAVCRPHRFSLDQLKYQYPDEPVPPGKTAQQHLEDLTWQGVAQNISDPDFDAKTQKGLAQGTAL